jgi:hypothetical protein
VRVRMSSATLVVPWSVCKVRSGAKVPVKACWLGPGIGVADVGAGDKGSDAAQWLLVDEQFPEDFPTCFGGWVVSRLSATWARVCSSARAPAKWRSL